MSLSEFELIERFFVCDDAAREDVILGVGDDAALLTPPPHQSLVSTIDVLVEGQHFSPQTPPFDLGYKALAVSLSDIAAMGALPAWALLSLVLPEADESWLSEFSRGFFTLLRRYNLALVGGNTARGPLSITSQVHGFVPKGEALCRRGAQVGDAVYVTGTLGDAAMGLRILQDRLSLAQELSEYFLCRLNRPEPRLAMGQALQGLATAAIDISDGLLADVKHVLSASHVGAVIDVEALPISEALFRVLPEDAAYRLALVGGGDYELCFTIAPRNEG